MSAIVYDFVTERVKRQRRVVPTRTSGIASPVYIRERYAKSFGPKRISEFLDQLQFQKEIAEEAIYE